jgi:hypothetical protein
VLCGSVQHNPPSRFLSEITTNLANNYGGGILPIGNDNPPDYSDNLQPKMLANAPILTDLHEGDSVEHQIFGVGTIISCDGDTISVKFNNSGVKQLNIEFAPLKKL